MYATCNIISVMYNFCNYILLISIISSPPQTAIKGSIVKLIHRTSACGTPAASDDGRIWWHTLNLRIVRCPYNFCGGWNGGWSGRRNVNGRSRSWGGNGSWSGKRNIFCGNDGWTWIDNKGGLYGRRKYNRGNDDCCWDNLRSRRWLRRGCKCWRPVIFLFYGRSNFFRNNLNRSLIGKRNIFCNRVFYVRKCVSRWRFNQLCVLLNFFSCWNMGSGFDKTRNNKNDEECSSHRNCNFQIFWAHYFIVLDKLFPFINNEIYSWK